MRLNKLPVLVLVLCFTACSSIPGSPSMAPTTNPTELITESTASPAGTASITLTLIAAETQAATQTITSTLSNTATPGPTPTPFFDITKRNGPPTDNATDYTRWMEANTPQKPNYLSAKWDRAQAIIANQDASDPRVIAAFLMTPREDFFSVSDPAKAYASAVYPIGYGQTISGPHLVAHMTQALDPQLDQRVLEVGTGSGYQSAILSELSNYVYTVEIVPQLAEAADARYTKLSANYPEYNNIKRINADGYYGWLAYAPFDRIIVTAGIDHVPPDLLAQLTPGGIMVIPVGPPSGQTVLKITKQVNADGSITFIREDIYHGKKILFVPFTGGHQNP